MDKSTFHLVELALFNIGAQVTIERHELKLQKVPQYDMKWSVSLVFKTWSGTFVSWQG